MDENTLLALVLIHLILIAFSGRYMNDMGLCDLMFSWKIMRTVYLSKSTQDQWLVELGLGASKTKPLSSYSYLVIGNINVKLCPGEYEDLVTFVTRPSYWINSNN